jgi:hypothetical protein
MVNNDTQIHTFKEKSKTGLYKVIVFFEIGITCLLLFLGYTFIFRIQDPNISKRSEAFQFDGASESDTPIPTKYEIQHNYTITDIGETDITLEGNEGELVIPKGGRDVLFFRGSPANPTKVSVTDLQIGQLVILEIVPGEKVWVYIL